MNSLTQGPLDTPGNPVIKLIETKATATTGPYMTLSHSLGKGHSVNLNKGTCRKFVHGVDPSSLPTLFREASFIARQPGVRYIWIDALCIFQDKDDLSDWSRVATLMHLVYANSLCNIVAAETADSSHSMLISQDPTIMISPVTAVTIQKRGEGLPRKYTFRDGHFGRTIDNAPVNTRAWVMQERYMSPRALHFGAQQVFWEYRDKIASELNPDGLSVGPGRRFKSQFVDMRDQHANKGGWEDIFGPMGDFAPSCHHHDERDDFISLVRNYSSCRLTFPTDKIIAFSAIMKQICGFWHHEPVAGMRSRCLENDLLWSASQDNEPSQYETYAAPSWSWASVKGKVDYPPVPFSSSLIRVEDYKLEYVTKDPTGAVRGGWLRLSGALRKVKLLRGDVNAPRAGSWSLTFDGAEIEWSNPKTPWVVKLDAPFDRFDDEN